MLKLSAKRPYDCISQPSGCSEHRIQFLTSPPPKRLKRTHDDLENSTHTTSRQSFPSPFVPSSPMFSSSPSSSTVSSPSNTISFFPQPSQPQSQMLLSPGAQISTEEVGRYLPRSKRQKIARHSSDEKLFSLEEVKAIVAQAVAEREQTLKTEYDNILETRLQEQFKYFAKFTEDFISRKLKEGQCTYVS